MNVTLERSQARPPVRTTEVRMAKTYGMDSDARSALAALEQLSASGRVAVAGGFMPDPGVRAHLARLGIVEQVTEADFFKFRHIVIPYCGVPPRERKAWEDTDHPLCDLTAPLVRRAQVALGLLRMEGAQALVIGRHDDPESQALARVTPGTKIIEDTTDTARLKFSPAFGVVCQTTLSPRRASWLLQQLRMRYRDATVTFLNTATPAMCAREAALENLLDWCDAVVIVGQPGEASCAALAEAALRHGKPAVTAASPSSLDLAALAGARRLVLTAGAFALDERIETIAAMLTG